jgi:hypothetical protein
VLAEGGRSLPVDAALFRPPSVLADLGLAMREAAVGVLGRDDDTAAVPLSASQQLSFDLSRSMRSNEVEVEKEEEARVSATYSNIAYNHCHHHCSVLYCTVPDLSGHGSLCRECR